MNLYEYAKGEYAKYGVDADAAVKTLLETPVSMHCWQGDDVLGFEGVDALTGGIQATGNYPGRARTADELRSDMDLALRLIPGTSKVNLHTNYLEADGKVDRDGIEPKHFAAWADWAADKGIGLDFNTTFFSHPKSENGTLTSPDPEIRAFWIEHGRRVRKIARFFAEKTGKTCVINHWVPDGSKEVPADTLTPRLLLKDSLDRMLSDGVLPGVKDSVESKLFGIGVESYTPGSNEFYVGYAASRKDVMVTLDAGHFHPAELISQKITAIMPFVDEMLLHVSRPVRWDSDHVVLFDDETKAIMAEIVRNDLLKRVYIATDYFDASINRVAAWVIGIRNTKKALLHALLEPAALLKEAEKTGDNTSRLAFWQAEASLPFGIVWNHVLETEGIADDFAFMNELKEYEKNTLSKR